MTRIFANLQLILSCHSHEDEILHKYLFSQRRKEKQFKNIIDAELSDRYFYVEQKI